MLFDKTASKLAKLEVKTEVELAACSAQLMDASSASMMALVITEGSFEVAKFDSSTESLACAADMASGVMRDDSDRASAPVLECGKLEASCADVWAAVLAASAAEEMASSMDS